MAQCPLHRPHKYYQQALSLELTINTLLLTDYPHRTARVRHFQGTSFWSVETQNLVESVEWHRRQERERYVCICGYGREICVGAAPASYYSADPILRSLYLSYPSQLPLFRARRHASSTFDLRSTLISHIRTLCLRQTALITALPEVEDLYYISLPTSQKAQDTSHFSNAEIEPPTSEL